MGTAEGDSCGQLKAQITFISGASLGPRLFFSVVSADLGLGEHFTCKFTVNLCYY